MFFNTLGLGLLLPITTSFGTSFGTGDSGTFTIPAIGVGESLAIMGWTNLPANPASNTTVGVSDDPNVLYEYYDGSYWQIMHSWGPWMALWNGTDGGWLWRCYLYSRTSITVYYRRAASRSLSQKTQAWTFSGAALNGHLYAFLGDAQYWRIYQGVPTEDQLLAESYSSTPILSCYSDFPLNLNSGTGTIGGRNITLSGTSAASVSAPVGDPGAANTQYSTLFCRYFAADCAISSYSPFIDSDTFTISYWAWLGASTRNAYIVTATNGAGEDLLFVNQHTAGQTQYATNLMSTQSGDWGTAYNTVTLAECEGWVFTAQVITSTGTSRSLKVFLKFGVSGTMFESTVNLNPRTETNWSSGMTIRIGNNEPFCVEHIRIHSSALNITQLNALALSTAPDTTAQAHWPLYSTDPLDVSGHNRHLNVLGDVQVGVAGPAL